MKTFGNLSNTEILKRLLEDQIIDINTPKFIFKAPKSMGKINFSKIEGMLLGIAIGDSLGNTSESKSVRLRNTKFGLITDYLPNKHLNYKKVGFPSDDTQLSFDTLDVILTNGYLNMDNLALIFSSHKIYGIGSTVKDFLRNYRDIGLPWYRAGVVGGSGNGALMRISPVTISYIKNDKENLWVDTILDTALTHNSALAIGSSVAFIDMVWKFLGSEKLPKKDKLLDDFTSIMNKIIGDRKYEHRSHNINISYSKNPGEFINQAITEGFEKGMSIVDFHRKFGSGAYVLETDTIALYIILNFGDKPINAIIQAVNYTRDNDTNAAIIGTAVGALHGRTGLKSSWIQNLSGITRKEDYGTIFKFIKETEAFLE